MIGTRNTDDGLRLFHMAARLRTWALVPSSSA